jgi:hypothetical protein
MILTFTTPDDLRDQIADLIDRAANVERGHAQYLKKQLAAQCEATANKLESVAAWIRQFELIQA